MKRLLAVTLGILTAIGGFVDIGDLVANSETGARFGMRLAWVVVVGVIGICVYAEMSGRVAAVSQRPVFDLIRERLGPRAALANLVGTLPGDHDDPDRRTRRRRAGVGAGQRRVLPGMGAAGGVRVVGGVVAGQIRNAGTSVRVGRTGVGDLRRGPV